MDTPFDLLASHRRRSAIEIGDVERTVSTFAGAALVAGGAVRRDLTGWLAIAAGGALIARGVSGRPVVPRALLPAGSAAEVEIVRSLTIAERPDRIQQLLQDPEQWLPGEIVDAVARDGDRWRISYRLGPLRGTWDAKMEAPSDEVLLVTSASEGSPLPRVEITLEDAPDGRGSELRASLRLAAGGVAGRSVQALRGIAERALGYALVRFRQVLETGEVARSDPQPHARRGRIAAVIQSGREAS